MDSPKTLDLARFPKITPPPPKEVALESAQRSLGIAVIEQTMTELVQLMKDYVVSLQATDLSVKLMEQERSELVNIEKQLRYTQHQLEIREKALSEQERYIESKNNELNKP